MANPRLVVRELRLEGGNTEVSYPFRAGVNIVLGAVGTGKSSLLELVKYSFGGGGVLSGAVLEGVTASVLRVDFDRDSYLLRRAIDGREVELRSGTTGALIERCHIVGTKSERSVSDALLGLLGLPRLEVPRSRAAPTADTTTVTFFDVLTYMYARQIEIDRSVAYHLDPIREPKRRATFEMLYGLTDASVSALQREIGELRTAVDETRRRNGHIDAFLRAGNEPGEDQLRLELEATDLDVREANQHLLALRQGIRSETAFADADRSELARLDRERDDALQEESVATAEISRLEAVAAQLDLDSQRITRSLVAGELLAPIEYTVCPRCQQSIRDRRRVAGLCVLCGQDEDVTDTEARLEAERTRIEDQIQETVALRTRTLDQVAEVRRALGRFDGLISQLRSRIDTRTAGYVSPLMDEIESASRKVERLQARRSALSRSIELWRRYREGLGALKELEDRLKEKRRELADAQAGLEASRHKVAVLSELFDEMLRDFRYPWYQRARIDPTTYLPIVNDEPFDRASGGMKTLINVAYHIAGLRYGLRHRDSLLPLFLMLDSPRKNLGAENVDDKLIGSQIYRRFRTMQDANPDDFQLIVADNDLPFSASEFAVVQLDYEHPLVPWVLHPGPERVTSIE